MKYYSQVAFAKKVHKSLITIWRYCKTGKIKTKITEVYQGDGRLVQTPLIPVTELKHFTP